MNWKHNLVEQKSYADDLDPSTVYRIRASWCSSWNVIGRLDLATKRLHGSGD